MSEVKRFKCVIHGMYAEDVVRAGDYDALAQRCQNLEVVQQASLERSGRIKAAAGALGWTADREGGPLEFLIEQAHRCRELEHSNGMLRIDLTNSDERRAQAERKSDALRAEVEALRGLIRECADYLNHNELTSIGHGSILHRKMMEANQ